MQRSIEAPPWEWGTSTQASDWLGIDEPTFLTLVKKGIVPEGRKFTRRSKRWHWQTVWAISEFMRVGYLDASTVEDGEENS